MKVYNTLTAREEEFVPQGDVVKMYVCGVTPYAECHLGHAMSYVVFDMVRRYLEFRGYRVKYVQNFTDIDDKIIKRAQEAGVAPAELAEKFIAQYFDDMDRLNIRRADVYPRATQEIPKIIEVVKGLIEKGRAYEVQGDVYFRVKSAPDYGKLSHQSLDDLQAGARVEVGVDKEHPLDFALWKAAKPGEPWWDSPWGRGRPGWHIECSAMSMRYLGETLDIHGGGQDLIFPHHENEIAQSEGFTGVKPFVKYWMHNGFVQLGGEKMSKSLGIFVTLRQALERFSPDALRLFILSSHYRSPINFSEEGVAAAEKGMERLRQAALVDSPRGTGGSVVVDVEAYRQRFIDAMDHDFNTPQALAALFDLARDINRTLDQGGDPREARQTLRELAGVLGLTFEAPQADLTAKPFIDLLVSLRAELRKEKHWGMADRIRTSLKDLGIVLEDTPQGTVWKQEKRSV
ncbi:MAG: cysteine--tRNA ligase [Dehalococcoidia bacterium]|nr:cysteine--tRNA ligase [Dehalococcoidia bacterium]